MVPKHNATKMIKKCNNPGKPLLLEDKEHHNVASDPRLIQQM